MSGCFARMYVSLPCTCLVPAKAKREGLSPLELELQMVSHNVGARNQTRSHGVDSALNY